MLHFKILRKDMDVAIMKKYVHLHKKQPFLKHVV